MLKKSISKIKYLMVLALLIAIPMQANAGSNGPVFPFINQTDIGTPRLTYFWDLRDRESFLQLTNITELDITVHVQIFNVNGDVICEEVNFSDTYTGNDTHVYDVRNLTRNDGSPAPTSDFTDGYGFAVISFSSSGGVIPPREILIGMFRVVDDAGYEYRANAANGSGDGDIGGISVLAFNDINGNDLTDVVGISFITVSGDTVYASPSLSYTYGFPEFPVLIFDEFENPQSCSPVTFACAPGKFIYGIDNSLPPSKGGSEICNASTLNANNTAGWLRLPFGGVGCDSDTDPNLDKCSSGMFIGFIGLNNGDGTGSMDSWWAILSELIIG